MKKLSEQLQEFVDQTITSSDLMNLTSRDVYSLKKKWVVDLKEKQAVHKVINVLQDCEL